MSSPRDVRPYISVVLCHLLCRPLLLIRLLHPPNNWYDFLDTPGILCLIPLLFLLFGTLPSRSGSLIISYRKPALIFSYALGPRRVNHLPLCYNYSLYPLPWLHLPHHTVTWVFICLSVCVPYCPVIPGRASAHLIPLHLKWGQVWVLLKALKMFL